MRLIAFLISLCAAVEGSCQVTAEHFRTNSSPTPSSIGSVETERSDLRLLTSIFTGGTNINDVVEGICKTNLTSEELRELLALCNTKRGKVLLGKVVQITRKVDIVSITTLSTTNMTAQNTSAQRPKTPFDPDRVRFTLKKLGYDSDLYDIDRNYNIVPRENPLSASVNQPNNTLPISPKFIIRVRRGEDFENYFSIKEPLRKGDTFKVKDVRGFEVTVSGEVTVIRLSD